MPPPIWPPPPPPMWLPPPPPCPPPPRTSVTKPPAAAFAVDARLETTGELANDLASARGLGAAASNAIVAAARPRQRARPRLGSVILLVLEGAMLESPWEHTTKAHRHRRCFR